MYRQVEAYFKHRIGVDEGDVVFDVGANIGLFALSAYERGKRGVTVYAFEPVPVLFEALKLNAERHGAGRLKVFPYGLSRECGTLMFSYFPNVTTLSTAYGAGLQEEMLAAVLNRRDRGHWLRRLVPRRLRAAILRRVSTRLLRMEPVLCEVVTLSSILSQQGVPRIDLLKVDVEKSEVDVLAGIEDQDWPKIRQLVVEVHDIDHRVDQVTALLRERGFVNIAVDPSVPIFGVFNVYARRA
jgi:FkbM family methyltransferase